MKASVLDSLPERLGDLEEVSNDGMSMGAVPFLALPSLPPRTLHVTGPDTGILACSLLLTSL